MANNPRGELVLRITIACGVLETIAVALRLLARWKSKAGFGADDYLIVATLIPSYCMLISGCLMITSGGAGRHAATLSRSQFVVFLKVDAMESFKLFDTPTDSDMIQALNSTLLCYMLTIAMAKISILLLYRRLFATAAFRKAALTVGAAVVAWAIAAILTLIFQCHPVSGAWNPDLTFSNQCINLSVYFSTVSGLNMALDIVVLCLPLWMVWHLKLDAGQKVMLSGTFTLGALTCAASMMRIVTVNLTPTGDTPYNITKPYVWSQIESTMAVVCACIITYRPLFTHLDWTLLSFLNWTKRPSYISKRMGQWTGTGTGTGIDNTDDSYGPMRMSGDKPFYRLEELNIKATREDSHTVNIVRPPVSASSRGDPYPPLTRSVGIETSYA